jgi:excisionase family DNA binding protein
VAETLAVCTATVYALCERGEIRHLRVLNAIRVHSDDLEAFIASVRGSPPEASMAARCFVRLPLSRDVA